MPEHARAVGADLFPFLVGDVGKNGDFRAIGHVEAIDHVADQRTEVRAEVAVGDGGQVLVPEDHHAMLLPGVADVRDGVGGDRPGKIHALDLGADVLGELADGQAAGGAIAVCKSRLVHHFSSFCLIVDNRWP